MKTSSLNRGLLVTVLACSMGCATIVNPSSQPVTIVSDPPAAEVIVGSEGMGSTPTDIRLRRNDSDAALRLQKDGFAPRVVRPRRSLSRWLIANLVVPAVLSYALSPAAQASTRIYGNTFAGTAGIAFLTDLLITGDGFTFPDTVRTTLTPAGGVSADPRQQQIDTRLAPDFHPRGAGSERLDAPASPETSNGSPMKGGLLPPTSRRTPGGASFLAAAREPVRRTRECAPCPAKPSRFC